MPRSSDSRTRILLCLFACLGLTRLTHADDSRSLPGLQIVPPQIELWHVGAEQSVDLYRAEANQEVATRVSGEACSDDATWWSANEKVCRIQDGRAVATGAGSATVYAEIKNAQGERVRAKATVVVRHAATEMPVEFSNHVQAVLARSGCNSGACHGALAGKGGFRLSLRGYDPIKDHLRMTQEDRGRRVELANPGQSLLLAKPSGAVPHQGGVRLPLDSPDYRIMADWVADGAPGPTASDPKLVRIDVWPKETRMQPEQRLRLLVTAKYDNGRVMDVTRWAKFTASDEAVAKVDDEGRALVMGPGEGAVSVWFGGLVQLAKITVPFPYEVEPASYDQFPIANFIDQHVLEQLKQLRLKPSDRCTDREFIRRAYLDTLGILPAPEQVERFVGSRQEAKRATLIEELLTRPEFPDYWAYRWSDVLMLNGNLLRPEPIRTYYQWIHQAVAQNKPWDVMVREILTARGESTRQGATNFYALNQDPESMTENACQAFLGLSIGCAKCHNHPLEKWTNDQYYAMANLFARVRAKGWGGDGRDGDGIRTVVVLDRGDLIQPLTGKPQLPAPLDAKPLDPNATEDRREYLAAWLTSPENPYFRRAIANRVWANFFGIGIVQPVDDLRSSNPPSNEPLLEALSQYLVAEHFDLKKLMRQILNSETYQRSSQVCAENQLDQRYFSHYFPKRLMAEVIHDAICQVTRVPSRFTEIEYLGADKRSTDFYPEGTRAIQLYDAAVGSYFLKTFGRNQRRITCECERSDEPSVVQVLHLSNGTTLNDKLASPQGIVPQLLQEKKDDLQGLVQAVFRECLSRLPTESEEAQFLTELKTGAAEERRTIVEDMVWSLLTSREFLFNH